MQQMQMNQPIISISLEGVVIHAFHGVFEQETAVGNDFCIDLQVDVPITEGMRNDLLDGTISYANLYETCVEEFRTPSQLLEHVALRISKTLRCRYPQIVAGRLRISKLHPPIPHFEGSASVSLKF